MKLAVEAENRHRLGKRMIATADTVYALMATGTSVYCKIQEE